MRKRAIPPKCPICHRALNRLYMRIGRTYQSIGWVCKHCGYQIKIKPAGADA